MTLLHTPLGEDKDVLKDPLLAVLLTVYSKYCICAAFVKCLWPSVDDGPTPCCSAPVEALVEGLVGVFCKPVWMALEEECDSGCGVTGESNDLLTGTGGCCEPMRSL